VRVLDHDQQRAAVTEPLEDRMCGVEEVTAVGVLRVHLLGPRQQPTSRQEPAYGGMVLGHRRGEQTSCGQTSEDLREREIGQRAVTEVEAVPSQHQPTGTLRALPELGQQTGLPHPRVAGQQHRAGLRPDTEADERRDLVELTAPPDQRGQGGGIGGHIDHHRRCHRHRQHHFAGDRRHVTHVVATVPPVTTRVLLGRWNRVRRRRTRCRRLGAGWN
jgi:hypothetical protein